jgi:hypothetical protein
MKLDGGVEMTAFIVGRPKRKRPTDRVNYKLDSDLRALLATMAVRSSRNEGAQVEQLIMFYEAVERLNADGQALTLDAINAKKNQLWIEITENDVDGEPGDD